MAPVRYPIVQGTVQQEAVVADPIPLALPVNPPVEPEPMGRFLPHEAPAHQPLNDVVEIHPLPEVAEHVVVPAQGVSPLIRSLYGLTLGD
ncbi:hypothetical protein RSOLAG1IB_01959 [Rhizoctonia solani AG-1 IB]|uniref:Uncharacterized protein n=1 Tax=Thanatephorus cucumeris (strain AG1-IB / isolate 7/3/14) TaxID=1108050 RepID=A0A0B7FD13_THACB|nr:hypothetical protein RSOLAG1IB_01959 [Rhizoctonia solani AG-1 IB]